MMELKYLRSVYINNDNSYYIPMLTNHIYLSVNLHALS